MYSLVRNGGQAVRAGTYWNLWSGDLVRMERAGALPGSATRAFLRIPAIMLLLLSPLLGLAFVMFLPVIGILLVLSLPITALIGRVRSARARKEAETRIGPLPASIASSKVRDLPSPASAALRRAIPVTRMDRASD